MVKDGQKMMVKKADIGSKRLVSLEATCRRWREPQSWM
jgi:hypothetical protein